jgi:hypothetical protein
MQYQLSQIISLYIEAPLHAFNILEHPTKGLILLLLALVEVVRIKAKATFRLAG